MVYVVTIVYIRSVSELDIRNWAIKALGDKYLPIYMLSLVLWGYLARG